VDEVLDFGIGFGACELGVEFELYEFGYCEAECACEFVAHYFGDECLGFLLGAVEFVYVYVVVVGFDEFW